MSATMKFKKLHGAYVGYAGALRTPEGSELIVICPTKAEVVTVMKSCGQIDVNMREIRRVAMTSEEHFKSLIPQEGA